MTSNTRRSAPFSETRSGTTRSQAAKRPPLMTEAQARRLGEDLSRALTEAIENLRKVAEERRVAAAAEAARQEYEATHDAMGRLTDEARRAAVANVFDEAHHGMAARMAVGPLDLADFQRAYVQNLRG